MRAKNCDVFYGYAEIDEDVLLMLMVEDHKKNRRWFAAKNKNFPSEFLQLPLLSFAEICTYVLSLNMKEFSVTPRFKKRVLRSIGYKK